MHGKRIVAGIVTNFLAPTNGLINIIIDKLGGEKIYFLVVADYSRTILNSMSIWQSTDSRQSSILLHFRGSIRNYMKQLLLMERKSGSAHLMYYSRYFADNYDYADSASRALAA